MRKQSRYVLLFVGAMFAAVIAALVDHSLTNDLKVGGVVGGLLLGTASVALIRHEWRWSAPSLLRGKLIATGVIMLLISAGAVVICGLRLALGGF